MKLRHIFHELLPRGLSGQGAGGSSYLESSLEPQVPVEGEGQQPLGKKQRVFSGSFPSTGYKEEGVTKSERKRVPKDQASFLLRLS